MRRSLSSTALHYIFSGKFLPKSRKLRCFDWRESEECELKEMAKIYAIGDEVLVVACVQLREVMLYYWARINPHVCGASMPNLNRQ
jgi:hypothetical protein